MERGGGAFGIGWRRKTRRKGIWEDPEVGFECGGGGGGILWSWSRVCPNRHVGGLYIGKGESLDLPIENGRTRINRLGSPIKKTEMFYRCLGMIRTQR